MLNDRFLNNEEPEINLNLVQKCALYKFQEELDNNEYVFESYGCDCGAEFKQLITLSEKDRYGLNVITKICPVCGMVMTNPRMNQQSYNRFYDLYYRQIYVGKRHAEKDYFEKQRRHGKQIYEYVRNNYDIKKVQRVLEIGCGAGGILSVFRDHGIEKCEGIDLGSEYIQFGKQKGLCLRNCSSQELDTKERFDLIILSHVLEHFLDIQKELRIIRELLSEDGILYIEVPGIKNIEEVYENDFLLYLQNAHIRYFSCETLTQMMSWNGFSRLCANENVQSIFFKGEYGTEIKNYKDNILDFIRKSEEEFGCSNNLRNNWDKNFDIMMVLNTWMNVNRRGKNVVDYLKSRFVNEIAIYGMGILGKQLYAELDNSDIKISFVIDKKEISDIKEQTFKPEDEFPAVDMIIMTTVGEYTEIRRTINRNRGGIVVPLVEIIYSLDEE